MKSILTKIVLTLCGSAMMSSCGFVKNMGSSPDVVTPPVVPQTVKVPKNTGYVAPTIQKPAPRNNVPQLSSNLSGNNKVSWSSGTSNGKYIAITFDDGPVASNTTRLLNMLKQRNIKATFYVLGPRVKSNQGLMRRMVAEGHEVGNHTWTHTKLTTLSDSGVRSELKRTEDAIIEATGIKPRTMRPPYGALSTRQRSMVFNEFGYPTILWDVDPEDWKKPGPSVIKNRILSKTKAGSIILLHDLHSASVDSVPATVDALLRQGYKFVTVSQLLAMSK